MALRNSLIFISFLVFLSSCKSYKISTDSLKKQFPYTANENIALKDSAPAFFQQNHHLDSISCQKSNNKEVKLNLNKNYLIKVKYINNKFWQTTSTALISPSSLTCSDSSIITKYPFYIGFFKHKPRFKIPFNKIDKIAIIEHDNRDIKLSIKCSPLALINLYEGYSVRAGLECKIIKNFSLNLEIGKYVQLTNRNGTGNGSGFSINPELRYYLNRQGVSVGKYFSLGYMYKDQTYFWSDSLNINNLYSNKNYDVFSKINIFNIKYGATKLYKNRLILDYFFGIGIQYRTSTSSLSSEEQSSIIKSNERGYYESKVAIGNFIQPSFHAGLKIGILLW